MSFALQVKEEIVSKEFLDCCKLAFLSGYINNSMACDKSDDSNVIKLSSVSNLITRKVYSFLNSTFDTQIHISIRQNARFKIQRVYNLLVQRNAKQIIDKLITIDIKKENSIFIYEEHCQRAYIAGCFVASGSVNSPETSNYHLEIPFYTLYDAKCFKRLLNKFHFSFNIIDRQNKSVCYIKKAIMVADFLKLVDAIDSVLEFENVRIYRDLKNSINRLNNIEISNQQKSYKAGLEQIKMIEGLQQKKLFDELNENTKLLAIERLNNPEASLQELSYILQEKYDLEFSKSGINHLFREIKKLYNSNF